MSKPVLEPLFLRIRVAEYLARLDSLNENYLSGNRSDYASQLSLFVDELRRFASRSPLSNFDILSQQYSAVASRGSQDDLYAFSTRLEHYLQSSFTVASSNINNSRKNRRALALGIVAAFVLLLGTVAFKPLKERYQEERQLYMIASNEDAFKQQTITDVLALKAALEKYYQAHHSYPASSGGFDAVNAVFGESKENWIPGLAPQFIKALPRDPRHSKNPREQYMYKSDGQDYKLIAHNPLGMDEAAKAHPELLDPARPSWAIGAWTEGAKNW